MPEPTARRHEREYRDIRTHLRADHGVGALGSLKLSTLIRHRQLHAADSMTVPHTHNPRSVKK